MRRGSPGRRASRAGHGTSPVRRAGAPARVPTGARRHPGALRARGDRVPLRVPMGQGRIPRRGRVLRALGLPDHDAARARVPAGPGDRAHRVLGPARPPPAPGPVPRPDLRRALHPPLRRALGAGRDPQRRHREPLLRRELAVRDRPAVLLHALLRGIAAAAHVVARDRGAVLHRVAPDRVGLPPSRQGVDPTPCRRVHGRRARLDLPDGHAVPGRRSLTRLLRHRHARAHAAHRRVARPRAARLDPVGALAQHRDGPRPARARRDVPRVVARLGRRVALLPRRVRSVRDRRGPRHLCVDDRRPGPGRPRLRTAPVDRPPLLRPLPLALADHRVDRPDPAARGEHDAERRPARGSPSRSRSRRTTSSSCPSGRGGGSGPVGARSSGSHPSASP